MIECRVPQEGFARWLRLLLKHWQLRNSYDLMFVGFPGQEIMFLAKAISRRPIIFDVFTSHYEGYVLDRRKTGPRSLRAKWYRFLDRWSCKMADLVLLDTQAHIRFFVKNFGLREDKFRRLFVGTDTDIFRLAPTPSNEVFTVHFHGNFIPLQGAEYIIKAAELLKDENIVFNLVGRGQTHEASVRLSESLGLKNIRFINPVPYETLSKLISKSDVCLGIFGDTIKTNQVIPNKVYEALACGRPVITSKTDAIQELLTDGQDVMLCRRADPEDIASKIRLLAGDESLRTGIGTRGRGTLIRRAGVDVLGMELIGYARELL